MLRLIPILLLLTGACPAQTTVRGLVKDSNGDGLPGVNILIRNSYDGTSSAPDGSFEFITTEVGAQVLAATSIGYAGMEIPITLDGTALNLDILLQETRSELDAIVISAGSFIAGDEKRRTILKPLDIATTAGATADIAGALNTLPGTQKVGESGRLFVRGGDGNEARTFVDGMVVLNPYGPSATNTPSRQRFLPFMFKGTSFSTGGYSAEYGQALSSALVLNSKDKAESSQTDIGLLSVGADVAHTQAWGTGSWSAKAQYTNLRPYMKLINQRVDWITAPLSLEGTALYRQEIGKGIVKAFGTFSQTDFSYFNHGILDPNEKRTFDLSNRYRYGNLFFRTELSDTWGLRSGLSYSYNENNTRNGGLPADEKEQGTHTKLVLEHALSADLNLIMGMEVLDRRYEASRKLDTVVTLQSMSFQETITANFAEAEAILGTKFAARLGLRYESNYLNRQSALDPRASIAYKPGGRGQFSLAFGSFRQSPLNQYIGLDPRIGQERASHFILNYQVITDRQTFRVETYWKKYSDLIKYQNGDSYRPVNTGNGYARGVEVFWRDNKTLRNVDYWISYSYLDTQRDYLNYPALAVPTFASAHNFSVVYKHFITSVKTQVGLTYSYTSGRPYYNPNLSSDQFQSERTPYYEDLSMNVSYLPRTWLIIHASITNVLGRDNVFGYEYSAVPDVSGQYVARAIRQPATHFIFLGVLITLSKNKTINQLPNL